MTMIGMALGPVFRLCRSLEPVKLSLREPLMPLTRTELFEQLSAMAIATTTVEHTPAFTVAESSAIEAQLPGAHTKNLFLKDEGPASSADEAGVAFVWGVLIVILFSRLRPFPAIVMSPVAFGAMALPAVWMQARHQIWFNWLVPAAAQTSIALLWSVGFQYVVETYLSVF